jgi:alanine racemase
MYTHFAAAKNPSFPDYTKKQIAQFEAWKAACAEAGFAPMFHASATAGAILFKEAEYDMVRIGIGTYGLWPSREVQAFAERRLPLQPVLSWKTRICEWKQVQKGEKISYDGTETLWRDSRIAVCPIGYWHGFPRALSSIGEVLVRGQRAKVLGRVAMDMIIIDCTDSGCDIGDEVVIIGRQGNEEVTLVEMAAKADASWYELVTRLNPLIKKIHVA